ncbi:hypothetical protein [Telluribacter sp. SYSU D00476]|uniref:hypothetical protein n=1 Tax=Telluribacter sp. SYSU D00476 TaxID=2811430 RepID=UPI001FF28EFD|nr:hypothetical protein [Telluribacter sp. SYSU D00476]
MTFFASLLLPVLLVAGSVSVPPEPTEMDSSGRWAVHIDNRYLLLGRDIINAWGGSVGRIWGEKEHEVTLGYYFFNPKGIRLFNYGLREQAIQAGQTTYSYTYPRYILAGYWHNLINVRQWKVGVPIELGVGQAEIRQFALDGNTHGLPEAHYLLLPAQAGGYVEWKATRWVGFGLQTGYHWELRRHQAIRNLNGVYYRIRLMTYPALFRDFRNFVFKGRRLRSPFWPMK